MEICSSTLCVAGSGRDLGRNRKISTQKASIVADIVAKYFCEEAPFTYLSRMQTGLHFEAFYVSWISL